MVGEEKPPLQVCTMDLGLAELDVAQWPDQLPHRSSDLARIQQRCGHLVQERREQVVVVAVEEQDVHIDALQCTRARDPAEAGARDDHARSARQRYGYSSPRSILPVRPFCGG